MKGKPKNLNEFLDGNAEQETPPTQIEKPAEIKKVKKASKITKTIRISEDMNIYLKKIVFERAVGGGETITESDLIDEALRFYIEHHK